MKHTYTNLQPFSACFKPISFTWDDETGEITGKDADFFSYYKPGLIIGTQPAYFELSSSPFTSKQDMSIMIGNTHHVPEDLVKYYPILEEIDPNVYDMDGNIVGQVTF